MRSPATTSPISPVGSVQLVPLDMNRLCSPVQVLLPVIGADEPEFCSEDGWLESVTTSLCEGIDQIETVHDRVQPMALVRCSRGGKTRALEEIGHCLRKKRPEVAVIFVSFNNYSAIQDWEHADPVAALCRRIAFAALNIKNPSKHDYDRFAKSNVVESDILKWLEDSQCVLLIDELNLFNTTREQANSIASFLKKRFLFDSGRFFVFSSHVLPRSVSLSNFMDSLSDRGVKSRQLPLVPRNLRDARTKLGWPTLTVREALYRGRIPAFIWVTHKNPDFNFVKRAAAIESVFKLWTGESVLEMLRSYITGAADAVFDPLLQLMNSSQDSKMIWIPFHMRHVLESCAGVEKVDVGIRASVRVIANLLEAFQEGKTGGGDSWEAIFVVSLLIRLFTRENHPILYLASDLLNICSVSFNELWNGNHSFEEAKCVEDLVRGMVKPSHYPHIAVYYPPHARFACYDVIVAIYETAEVRALRGYQLKEGREIPDDPGTCANSVLIRGVAAQRQELLRRWIMASDSDIDSFLGVTGASLAPKVWREMNSSE